MTPGQPSGKRRNTDVLNNDENRNKGQTNSSSVSLDPQIVYYNDKVFSPFLEQHFNMQLHQIRGAVMYVSKFLALNLELDPPDCSGLGDDPEDVSTTLKSQFLVLN